MYHYIPIYHNILISSTCSGRWGEPGHHSVRREPERTSSHHRDETTWWSQDRVRLSTNHLSPPTSCVYIFCTYPRICEISHHVFMSWSYLRDVLLSLCYKDLVDSPSPVMHFHLMPSCVQFFFFFSALFVFMPDFLFLLLCGSLYSALMSQFLCERSLMFHPVFQILL